MVEKNDIPPQGRATYPRPVEYDHDAKGNIVLPEGAPFDGNPVLIKIGAGWVEARWEDHDKMTDSGFGWVVLDDALGFTELDDAQEWAPLPGAPAEGAPAWRGSGWNSRHPNWESFHDVVGSAALELMQFCDTHDRNEWARQAHKLIAAAAQDCMDLLFPERQSPAAPAESAPSQIMQEMAECGTADAFDEADFAILYREINESNTTTMQEITNVPEVFCREIARLLRSSSPAESIPFYPKAGGLPDGSVPALPSQPETEK